jgi:hypothetical protein
MGISETGVTKFKMSLFLRVFLGITLSTIFFLIVFDVCIQGYQGGVALGLFVQLFLVVVAVRQVIGRGSFKLKITKANGIAPFRWPAFVIFLCLFVYPAFTTLYGSVSATFKYPLEIINGIFGGSALLFVILSSESHIDVGSGDKLVSPVCDTSLAIFKTRDAVPDDGG